ncbi:MAG: cupin domain-containing protein [Puniceicoccales bacterium]
MGNLREQLGLIAHPEGGAFRELFKSSELVAPRDGRPKRSALTHIYFHLKAGEVSRFHKVLSDEVWHLYQGEGVILYLWKEGDAKVEKITVGSPSTPHCCVVQAGYWQAAEPVGEEALVGCTVGPGFEFADFSLIETDSPEADALREVNPQLEKFL